MKRRISALAALAICLLLCSCSAGKSYRYDPSDYILETAYKDDFRILQLTDIHMAAKDERDLHYDFIRLTVEDAHPDMIVVTGDTFTFADKTTAKEVFDFLDSFGVPWSITFGNHDEQCYFSIDWMTDYLNNYGSNCLFKDIQDDDVFGNANYAVNLTKDGKVFEQVIIMDSNRYNYGDYWGYDYIKEDQIDWYERLVKYTSEQNGGQVVPSLLMFHIPVPEFQTAWDLAQAGSSQVDWEYGTLNEPCSVPKYNSGFFDKITELGSSNAIIVGHDHIDNFRIKYKGVYLCYGVNSTDRIYREDSMMGGHVIVVHNDGSLDFEHIYHSYGEVER